MIGHAEPILPRGDPNAEKPQPKLHLDAPIHNDNAVRQEIIAEEEEKELHLDAPIHNDDAVRQEIIAEEEEKETVEDETPSPLVEPNKPDHEKVMLVSKMHEKLVFHAFLNS